MRQETIERIRSHYNLKFCPFKNYNGFQCIHSKCAILIIALHFAIYYNVFTGFIGDSRTTKVKTDHKISRGLKAQMYVAPCAQPFR